jgi:hypothetical protein
VTCRSGHLTSTDTRRSPAPGSFPSNRPLGGRRKPKRLTHRTSNPCSRGSELDHGRRKDLAGRLRSSWPSANPLQHHTPDCPAFVLSPKTHEKPLATKAAAFEFGIEDRLSHRGIAGALIAIRGYSPPPPRRMKTPATPSSGMSRDRRFPTTHACRSSEVSTFTGSVLCGDGGLVGGRGEEGGSVVPGSIPGGPPIRRFHSGSPFGS